MNKWYYSNNEPNIQTQNEEYWGVICVLISCKQGLEVYILFPNFGRILIKPEIFVVDIIE